MTSLRRPYRLLLAAALALLALSGCGSPIRFHAGFATDPGPRVYEGGRS